MALLVVIVLLAIIKSGRLLVRNVTIPVRLAMEELLIIVCHVMRLTIAFLQVLAVYVLILTMIMVRAVLVWPVILAAPVVYLLQAVLHAIPPNNAILPTRVHIVCVWTDTTILECRPAAAAIPPAINVPATQSTLVQLVILSLSGFFRAVLVSV